MCAHSSQFNRPLIVTSKVNPYLSEAITLAAWEGLEAGGSPLDAAEKAVNLSELDPRDPTVGYGGTPNEEGFFNWTRRSCRVQTTMMPAL